MDRVRETLFAWLGPRIAGANVLDLFAGTGALGFEALSRGARHATFVERDPGVAAALRTAVRRLGAEADCDVIVRPAEPWLKRQREWRWDFAFLDPPFGSGAAPRVLELLRERPVTVYLEEAAGADTPTLGWQTLKEGRAGACRFRLLHLGEAVH